MQLAQPRPRRGAQLLVQERAAPPIDAQRLGQIPTPLERLHQQAIAGLAVGRTLDHRTRRALPLRRLGPAELRPRRGHALQCPDRQVVELPSLFVKPRRLHAHEQPLLDHLERLTRPRECLPKVRPLERGVRRRYP
jgi:hypothetical protein